MLFKIGDASGQRKYLITVSNLTELTLIINKSSKNVLLKYSFNLFYIVLKYCLFRFFSPGVGTFLTLLINLSFPTLGNLIKKFRNLSNPHPLPTLPPHGVYIDRCINFSRVCLLVKMASKTVTRSISNAPINVNPVRGGAQARGGDLTNFKIF